MRLILVAICLYMIWGYSAQADAATAAARPVSQTKASVPKLKKPGEEKFSIILDLSHSSNLREQSDTEYTADTTLMLQPEYRISSKAKVFSRIDLIQNHGGEQKSEMANALVGVRRDPIALTSDIDLKISLNGYLPTNETDRIDNSYMGGVGTAIGLRHEHSILGKSGSFEGTISLLENFYEFKRNNLDEPNLNHRARFIVTAAQDLPANLSLEVVGRYQVGETYDRALRTAFFISEQLSLGVSETASLYVAHTNEGNALNPNGIDSNVRIYDERSSVWSSGVEVTF